MRQRKKKKKKEELTEEEVRKFTAFVRKHVGLEVKEADMWSSSVRVDLVLRLGYNEEETIDSVFFGIEAPAPYSDF